MSQWKRPAEQDIHLHSKRTHVGSVNPGWEYVEPRVYQQPAYQQQEHHSKGTNFKGWTDEQIKAFLDQRGADYDDCPSREQLVERAIETEINSGPAAPPSDGGASCATGAAGAPAPTTAADAAADADDYDPLEAFMADISKDIAAAEAGAGANKSAAAANPALACDEAYDPGVEYMSSRRQQQGAGGAADVLATVAAQGYDSDEEVYATARALEVAQGRGGQEYDEDDNAVVDVRKGIDPLAPVDFTGNDLDEFAKDFYTEQPAIAAMSQQQVNELRRQLEVRVSGFDPPKPIQTFGQAGFDHLLLGAIKRHKYEKPTAIQAQALPAVLSGRDVLGIAKTGSGKTAAFVLPMIVHIMDQPELQKGEGPIGLVAAPTRELAEQIHKETRNFCKPYGLQAAAAFGGLSKFDQVKELKAGCEIAICTPGRMIDLIKMKACTLARVTYLVLDEADRMLDMGFEAQVRSLLGQIRPDRQTLLFSATLPRKIDRLISDALSNPVRITVGQMGVANEDIRQAVQVFPDEPSKAAWLSAQLEGFIDAGDVLVFAGQRARVDELVARLQQAGVKAAGIHGDMDQYARMHVLDAFRAGQHHVLVATDVAARGLDIKSIKTVINYEPARDIDTHIHRVGRTGRAGDKDGTAWTLLDAKKDAHFAGLLLNSLTLSGQEVPEALHKLAMKDPRFRRGGARGKGGKGGKGGKRRGPQVGGAGLGFGASSASPGVGSNYSSIPTAANGSASTNYPPPPPAAAGAAAGLGGGAGAGTGTGGTLPGAFVQLPGFARAHGDYEHESSAAAASTAPPPEGGASASRSRHPVAAAGASSGAGAGDRWSAPAAGVSGREAAAGAPDASAEAMPEASSRGAAAEYVRGLHNNKFRSSFVSSGVTGGDIGQTATVVMPKSSASKATVPPPVPVTQRPMYLTRPAEGPIRRTGGAAAAAAAAQQARLPAAAAAGGGGAGVLNPAAVQSAAAAAAAIAARLAAQAPGAIQVPGAAQVLPAAAAPPSGMPGYSMQGAYAAPPAAPAGPGLHASIAAAQAVAARLAAAGGGSGQGAVPPPWAQQQQQQQQQQLRRRWDST